MVMSKREVLNYIEDNYNHYIDREKSIEEINDILTPWNVRVKEASPDQILSYQPSKIVSVDELREILNISAGGTDTELVEYVESLIGRIETVKTLVTHIGQENEDDNHVVLIRAKADIVLKVLNIHVYYLKVVEEEKEWIFVENAAPGLEQTIPGGKVSVLNLKTEFITKGNVPKWDLYLNNPSRATVTQQLNYIERKMKKEHFKSK
jgi:hypothetical protein